ncbi:MAG TPA: glycosyltransferase family 4 protein [Conexibacter sp.]|nr:glycosyltransferase family 4 protein [Conexibacter sp.]
MTSPGASKAASAAREAVASAPRDPNAPVRVLLLHNRYRDAGGEERVVDELEALLAGRGHAVGRLERDSEAAGRAQAARGLLRGGLDPGDVAAAVRLHHADVVHAHNLHPLLGWRALAAARAAGARTVLHLHNYRLVCAIGVAYRDGEPCYLCRGRDTRPGLRHRCRASRAEGIAYAAGLARQQPQLLAHADALVSVSEALAARLAELGIPRERMTVVPNAAGAIAPDSRAADGTYALVAGRLVEEKGFDVAVRAARDAGVPLRVAGTGPAEARLRALAASAGVTFLGRLSAAALARERRGAAVLLAPSRNDDPCPMTVVEALADGLPVLGSARGGIPELIGDGATLPPDDPAAWCGALSALWSDPARRAAAGADALARARARHSPDAWYAGLLGVYGGA